MSFASSGSTFDATLDLRLTPSARALRWLYAVHIVPLMLISLAMPPGLPMLGLAVGFGLSWFHLRRHTAFGYGPRSITRLLWQADRGWQLWQANGAHAEADLAADSFLGDRLIILNLRYTSGGAAGRRNSRVLLGDELTADAERRLRALLLLHRRRASAAGRKP